MNVILSIKPKYVKAILSGEKKYEFRKVIFKDKNVEWGYIYSSSPIKKIVGRFIVGEIIKDHPRQIWKICQEKSGMGEDDFFTYFNGWQKGYAIKIEDLETMKLIDPQDIFMDFVPPQSFCYFEFP